MGKDLGKHPRRAVVKVYTRLRKLIRSAEIWLEQETEALFEAERKLDAAGGKLSQRKFKAMARTLHSAMEMVQSEISKHESEIMELENELAKAGCNVYEQPWLLAVSEGDCASILEVLKSYGHEYGGKIYVWENPRGKHLREYLMMNPSIDSACVEDLKQIEE